MKKARVTSRDVAQVAGVSYNTVSLVMRDSPLVAPDTKARVLKVIAQLGYQPHAAAAALRSSRSHVIAYFTRKEPREYDAEVDVFYNQLLRAITTRTEEAAYHVLLASLQNEQTDTALLNSGRVDGALIHWLLTDSILKSMVEHESPVVLVGRDAGSLPISWVKADEENGAYQATRHLLELGHQHIGLITAGDTDHAIAHERITGYQRALSESAITLEPHYIADGDWTYRSGYDLGLQLLTQPQRPTAIFALNELMAAGVLHAAQSLGLNVPFDLALVTTEDSPWVEYVRPQLTAVHVPMYQVGKRATEILLALLDEAVEGPQQEIVPTFLVIRESSVPR